MVGELVGCLCLVVSGLVLLSVGRGKLGGFSLLGWLGVILFSVGVAWALLLILLVAEKGESKAAQISFNSFINDGWVVETVLDEESKLDNIFFRPSENVYLVYRTFNGNKVYGILSSESYDSLEMEVVFLNDDNKILKALEKENN